MIDAPTLKKLRELASKATPGPWSVDPVLRRHDGSQMTFPRLRFHGSEDMGSHGSVCINECGGPLEKHNATAAFIAAANPQTVLALLDHVNDLEQQRDADIARGLGDALAIVQRRLGHYQRMTGPGMKAHPATIATLEEIAVFIEAALMRALEPDREPGDGYCACGERLDKPHNHDGDFR